MPKNRMKDNTNIIDKKENIFYSVTKKLPKYNIIFKKILGSVENYRELIKLAHN